MRGLQLEIMFVPELAWSAPAVRLRHPRASAARPKAAGRVQVVSQRRW